MHINFILTILWSQAWCECFKQCSEHTTVISVVSYPDLFLASIFMMSLYMNGGEQAYKRYERLKEAEEVERLAISFS